MRILHVVPTYFPAVRFGGPILSVHGLCKSFVSRGHDVQVFTTNVDGPKNSDVPLDRPVAIDGVKVHYFRCAQRRIYRSPDMARALGREADFFDIIHAHSVFLWPTAASCAVARSRRVPHIISPRGMLVRDLIRKRGFLRKSLWIHFIERKNLENASALHATSTLEAEELKRFGLKLPPVFVVPNGVEVGSISVADAKPGVLPDHGKPFILFIGRLSWKKGLDRLIEAMALVPDVLLMIVGNDDERIQPQLEAQARRLGIEARVRFLGPMYGAEKWTLLGAASAFVLPSLSENFGNAALEAMAVGCPVVLTPGVGLAKIVRESGAGLVTEGSPQAIAESVTRLLSDDVARRRMGSAGRQTAQDLFSWDVVMRQMESVYRQMLAGSSR